MTVPVRIVLELDDAAFAALGRGLGEALAPAMAEIAAALRGLRTDIQAANWSAYERATGAREDDETGAIPRAALPPGRSQGAPQSAQRAPGPGCQVPSAPASAPPSAEAVPPSPAVAAAGKRKRHYSPEGLEKARAGAAKARAAMAARRAAKVPVGGIAADYAQIATWCSPRGIPFATWNDLPRVNAKRVELGQPPFVRRQAGQP